MDVFQPIYKKDLTKEQIKCALRALTVIKEKRDDTLKERTVADGNNQRPYYDKTETASPTPHIKSFMMMTAIEAFEQHHVRTGNVRGAFLHAK